MAPGSGNKNHGKRGGKGKASPASGGGSSSSILEGSLSYEADRRAARLKYGVEGEGALPIGQTFDGVEFSVPHTPSVMERWLDVRQYAATEYIRLTFILIQVVALFTLPPWVMMVSFLFWRFMYDGFIGVMLHYQSHAKLVTRFIRAEKAKDSHLWRAWRWITVSALPPDFEFDSYPAAFQEWLLWRQMVDFILNNDVASYFCFCLAYWELPETLGLVEIAQYVVAVALFAFAGWAKSDALRVLKDFAWYWGDFFFLMTDQTLVFDGIFEMFPHPMYSVGYSFFYGSALLTRSYPVLYVSLAAHAAQLVFLAKVENPHIERTYGSFVREDDMEAEQILYNSETGYFHLDMIAFRNIDLLRSSDVALVVLILTYLGLCVLRLPLAVYIAIAVIWRVIHSAGIGAILHKQSKESWFTQHFLDRGYTLRDAFANWKEIYNMSLTMTHVTFVMCAVLVAPIDWGFGALFARQLIGCALIFVNLWSSTSTFAVLREFGWFYGDFFIREYTPKTLYYTGIYRYLNNPESVTGFAGYYGLALISDSWVIFALALFSQGLNALFVVLVEKPHMLALYGETRSDGGLASNIKTRIQRIPEVQALMEHPTTKAIRKGIDETVHKAKERTEDIAETTVGGIKGVFVKARGLVDEVKEVVEDSTVGRLEKMVEKVVEAVPLPVDGDGSGPSAADDSSGSHEKAE